MAEQTTTSIQSTNPEIMKESDSSPNVLHINKIYLQTTRTNMKGNDQSFIPVQTNLRRLIQNKLKRKKRFSQGPLFTDDNDTENKKRRTKDDITNSNVNEICDKSEDDNKKNQSDKVVTKPPLPPKTEDRTSSPVIKPPPPRLKRKLNEQNMTLIQRLNAQAEQLRLEVSSLKVAVTNERNAVRALRAQNESDVRKSKAEIKRLQTALELSRKAAAAASISSSQKKSLKDEMSSIKDAGGGELGKLSQEILALKEANRVLEEKIQICSEAERRKTSDIRELKDSYEIRLTQISKSAKTEIGRLLEEIKTKERTIGQLKKEIHSIKSGANKRDTRNAQHPSEMRKLKDIERTNSTNNPNQKCITATCGDSEFNAVPHEITERILKAHNDLTIYSAKDSTNSDTDSAVSSAPQSISPQPPPGGVDQTDFWNSMKNYSKELENLQRINESVQTENKELKMELESTKKQIVDIEKTALETEAQYHIKIQHFIERIKYLEQREDILMKETHELREQSELLEFRILELEESHDKWSLRSNSTPDTRDMWTDTEKESDDLLTYMDRSDSGITSPHSHHHIDDRNVVSPCDLSLLDQLSNDEVKRRIAVMTKRQNIDEEDKMCLLQVLNLINNLETLSQDSLLVTDEIISLDMVRSKASDYSSISSSPRSLLVDPQPVQKSKNSRIIATIPPYSSSVSTPNDSPRKFRSWNSNSLQESGVFEGDSSECTYTQSTQTEPEDFPCPEAQPSGDLCAEIQKLNKFREKIECVTKQTTKVPVTVPAILSPNLSDQRRLQYYKDRLELLENKILIYESSGDLQTKRLAERLQREIQLESLVKELKQRVENLEVENLKLEEEKCEFEEAENDTRLRLQRLEVDLEILNQRNLELEMSKEAAQSKLKEVRNQCATLQDTVQNNHEKIAQLEEERVDLNNRIGLIKTSMPALLLFGAFMVYGGKFPSTSEEYIPDNIYYSSNMIPPTFKSGPTRTESPLKRERGGNEPQRFSSGRNNSLNANSNEESMAVRCCCDGQGSGQLKNQLNQLMDREKELTQNICELNRAYQETMENADILWAQIEKGYKDQLSEAKTIEQCLKLKISQLEQRLSSDAICAQERIVQLEENETDLKQRICCLHKENKELVAEHETLLREYQCVKDEICRLKRYLEGPNQDILEREKKKCKELEEDMRMLNRMMAEMDECHQKELQILRTQLQKVTKELANIDVTNSELKEEVVTLEKQIRDLHMQHKIDEERIICLEEELKIKGEALEEARCKCKENESPSLAQEMGTAGKRLEFDDIKDLRGASKKLAEALANIKNCSSCAPGSEAIQEMASDVKHLANTVVKNQQGGSGEEVSEEGSDGGSGGGGGGEGEDEGQGEDEGEDNGEDEDKGENENRGEDEGGDKGEDEGEDEGEGGDENQGEGEAPAEEDTPAEAEETTVGMVLQVSPVPNLNEWPVDEGFKLRPTFEQIIDTKEHSAPLILPPQPTRRVFSKILSYKPFLKPRYLKPLTNLKPTKSKSRSILETKLDSALKSSPGESKSVVTDAFQQTDSETKPLVSVGVCCDLTPSEHLIADSAHVLEQNVSKQNYIEQNHTENLHTERNLLEQNLSVENVIAENRPPSNVSDNISGHVANTIEGKSKESVECTKKRKKRRYIDALLERIYFHVPHVSEMYQAESDLRRLYSSDNNFKEDLKILLRLTNTIPSDASIKSYEEITRALRCIRIIEDIYKTFDVPGIKDFEDDVTNKMIEYHVKSLGENLVCQVYYPEPRF